MTINGPAPDRPGVLPQHRDRPAGRQVPRRARAATPTRGRARRAPAYALANVRGTVQADILKEDQGQNTCLFSTEFSLRMMADIQEWFIAARRCATSTRSRSPATTSPRPGRTPSASSPSPSPTGSPTSRPTSPAAWTSTTSRPTCRSSSPTAWTPSTPCIGRVARRIWAVAMREKYGANERSQKLKYHVQTSGRSLHAQEMDFNDIRTTLQALIAIYDNANSPAHQRLRRGRHHARRGVGAPGARDPADHQPRVGPGDEREPAPGLVHHRRAHRPRRGGRARRVRPHHRARRRARRDGDRLPARPDPGRVDALRAPQARRHPCRSSASTPSASPTPTTAPPTTSSSPGPPRTRSSRSSPGSAPSRTDHADEAADGDRAAQGGRDHRATTSSRS